MKAWTGCNLAILAALASVSSAVGAPLTKTYPFDPPTDYVVSDPTKIEVIGGVARLKLQPDLRDDDTVAEYLPNGTNVSGMALGTPVSLELPRVGGLYSTPGVFESRVHDVGGGAWQVLDASVPVSDFITDAQLRAWYKLDNSWKDEVTGGFATTLGSPLPSFSTDAVRGTHSGNFGVNSYARAVNPQLLNGATSVTVSFWVKLRSRNRFGTFIFQRTPELFGVLQLEPPDTRVIYYVRNQGLLPPDELPLNTWTFIAMTWSNTDQIMRAYFNGKATGTATLSQGTMSQTEPLYMSYDPANRGSDALMDDVRIYNRQLSAVEIGQQYQSSPRAVQFRVRSGNALPLSGTFVGPDGTANSSYAGQQDSLVSAGGFDTSDRYMQYRATSLASVSRLQASPIHSVVLRASTGDSMDDTLHDFGQGVFVQNFRMNPSMLDTPFLALSPRANGGMEPHGIYTSEPIDAAAGGPWSLLQWVGERSSELTEEGVRAAWLMENNWADSSGNGFAGTPQNVAFTSYAKGGRASGSFNGANALVSFGNVGTGIRSVEFWVQSGRASGGILELSGSARIFLTNHLLRVVGVTAPTVYVNGQTGYPALLPGWNHVVVSTESGINASAVVLGRAGADYLLGQMDDVFLYQNVTLPLASARRRYERARRFVAGKVGFQVRAGDALPLAGEFVGPSGAASFFETSSGGSLAGIASGRYIQYRIHFLGDGVSTPSVEEVRLFGPATIQHTNAAHFAAGTLDRCKVYGDEIRRRDFAGPGPSNLRASEFPALVGLWHFDETQWPAPGTVVDASLAGNHGSPFGAPTPVAGARVGTRCASFGGVADYIATSPVDTGGGDFSAGVWFRTPSTVRGALMSSFSPGADYFRIEVNGTGSATLAGSVAFVLGNAGASQSVSSGAIGLNDNQWHHVAGVRQGQSLHLYLDGRRIASALRPAGIDGTSSSGLVFARNGSSATLYYSGFLDEAAVFGGGFALSGEALGAMTGAGFDTVRPGRYSSGVFDAGRPALWKTFSWGGLGRFGEGILPGTVADELSVSEPGLRHLWRMNLSWADSVGVRHGTPSGSVSFDASDPAVGSAAGRFSGGSVSAGSAVASIRSLVFWVRPELQTDSLLELQPGTSLSFSARSLQASFPVAAYYVNGVPSRKLRHGWNHVVVVASNALSASSVRLGIVASDPYAGWLDDVALFDRALDAGNAHALFLRQSAFHGLGGLWRLEEAAGSLSAADATGQQSPGGAVGVSFGVAGKFGRAAVFSGASHLDVPHGVALSRSILSVSLWARPLGSGVAALLDKRNGFGDGYALTQDVQGRPVFTVNGFSCAGALALRQGAWQYVVGTYDGEHVRLYLDGDVAGEVAVQDLLVDSVAPLVIGARSDGTQGFIGELDDVAVFTRPLRAAEVHALYAAGTVTLRFQARSGATLPLTGPFVGPDGTSASYLTDPLGTDLSTFIPRDRYFEYIAEFDTGDHRLDSILRGVRTDISTFPDSAPFVMPAVPEPFSGRLLSFTQTLSLVEGNAGVQYQISGDPTNWFYWSSIDGVWAPTLGTAYGLDTSPWNTVNARVGSFFDQLYPKTGGDFRFRAFLFSEGADDVHLDQLDLNYAKGRVVVEEPNGTEVGDLAWLIGVPYDIRWSSAGIVSDNLIIEYSENNGTNWTMIATNVPNTGVYANWITPGLGNVAFNRDQMRIRIRDALDPTIRDMSDASFWLRWRFQVVAPNGGETWYTGSTTDIVWNASVDFGPVRLDLIDDFADGRRTTNEIAAFVSSQPATRNNRFAWSIPTDRPELVSERAKVRVQTTSGIGTDLSDDFFTLAGNVITRPTLGDALKVGNPFWVEWRSAGAGSNVAIEVSRDAGATWAMIDANASNVTGTNRFLWVVSTQPTTSAVLRVTSKTDPRVVGMSKLFTLADINVLQPNSASTWLMRTTNNIVWLSAGGGDRVNLYYTRDAGQNWTSIVTNYPNVDAPSSNMFPWVVEPFPGPFSGIKVESVLDPTNLFGLSGNYKVAGVRIADPNGGELRRLGIQDFVYWEAESVGTLGNLDVTYDGGLSWTSAAPVTGVGLVDSRWPHAPTYPSVRAKYRLTPMNPGPFVGIFDASDENFTVGGILPTVPGAGSVLTAGTTNAVRWIAAGAVDPLNQARIYYDGSGGAFTTLVAAVALNQAYPGENLFQWMVGQQLEPSTTARLRIESGTLGQPTYFFGITAPFTVRGVQLRDPGLNALVRIGDPRTIRWASAGMNLDARANLFLSTDDGTTFGAAINPGTFLLNNKSYDWPQVDPAADPTDRARLRLTIATSGTAPDIGFSVLSQRFTLQGLKLQRPTTGDSWPLGSTNRIVFRAAGIAGTAQLRYSSDNGVAYDSALIANNLAYTPGSNHFDWAVELSRVPSTNARVKVTLGAFEAVSPRFTVSGIRVNRPQSTDIWAAGDTNAITWTAVGATAPFALQAVVDGGTVVPIAAGVAGSTYDWVVPPAAVGTNVVIEVRDQGILLGRSQPFTVVPNPVIVITTPRAGTFVRVSDDLNFVWIRGGQMQNDFTVDLTIAPFAVTNRLLNGAAILDATNNFFRLPYSVPDAIGAARLTIRNKANSNVWAISDFYVAPLYRVTSPNGGEQTIFANRDQAVTWFTRGSVGQSDLYYSLDPQRAPSSWVKINTTPINDNGFGLGDVFNLFSGWVTPDVLSTSAWIRVQQAAFTNRFAKDFDGPFDDSNAPFDIRYYEILWRVMDAATSNTLDALSVSDSSGWSASGLSGVPRTVNSQVVSVIPRLYPFGVFDTQWSRRFFSDKVVFRWNSEPSRMIDVYLDRSAVEAEPTVLASFLFNNAARRFSIRGWMERGGQLIDTADLCRVTIYDATGQTLATVSQGSPVQGFFLLDWDVAATETALGRTFSDSEVFLAKVEIRYSGALYSSGVTFELRLLASDQIVAAIQAAQSNILESVLAVDTNVTGVASNLNLLSSNVASGFAGVQSSLAGISGVVERVERNVTGAIGDLSFPSNLVDALQAITGQFVTVVEAVTNMNRLVDAIADDTQQGLARILNRSTTVTYGDSVSILYKTRSGYTDTTLIVTNADDGTYWQAPMPEVGTTGIYERKVTFNFGLGVYTVICRDPSAEDRILISVNSTNNPTITSIIALSNQLSVIENSLTNIDRRLDLLGVLTGDLDTVSLLVQQVSQRTAVITNQLAGLEGLSSLSGSLGQVAGLTTALQALVNSGIGDLASAVTGIAQRTVFISNQLGRLDLLAQGFSNIDARTAIMTNQLAGLEGLASLSNGMDVVQGLVSNLQNLLATGIGELGTNVSQIVQHTALLTNRVAGLGVLTGQLDAVYGLVSNLQGLAASEFTGLGAALSNIAQRTSLITNQLAGLEGLSGISGTMGGVAVLISNLDTIISSGIGNMASNILAIGIKADVMTNQLAGLESLSSITGALGGISELVSNLNALAGSGIGSVATNVSLLLAQSHYVTNVLHSLEGTPQSLASLRSLMNSNLQFLVASGIDGLAVTVSNVANSASTITGQLAALRGLTLSVSNLQHIVGAGIPTLLQISSNVQATTSVMSNQLAGLEGLATITGSLDTLGALVSNLQFLQHAGIGDLSTNVALVLQRSDTITNQLAGLQNLAGITASLDNVAMLVSNLQFLQGAGIGELSTNVALVLQRSDTITNQLAGLQNLAGITNNLAIFAELGSNLQILAASGLGQVGTNVREILDAIRIVTNQVAGIEGLSNVTGAIQNLSGLVTSVQTLAASGLGTLSTNVASILAQTTAMTNVLVRLDALAGATGSLGQISTLVSSLQTIASSGIGSLATNVADMLGVSRQITNQLAGLDGLGAITGSLDDLLVLISNLDALSSGGLGAIGTNVASILTQTTRLTNQVTRLEALQSLTGIVSVLQSVTGSLDTVAALSSNLSALGVAQLGLLGTNVSQILANSQTITNQLLALGALDAIPGALTNLDTSVVGMRAQVTNVAARLEALFGTLAGADLSGLAELPALLAAVGAIEDSTDAIVWTDIEAIRGAMETLQLASGSRDTVLAATSNLVATLEDRLGEGSDTPEAETVFGRLQALEDSLGAVGGDAAAVRRDARSAKTAAGAAQAGVSELRRAIGEGDVAGALRVIEQIREALERVTGDVQVIRDDVVGEDLGAKLAGIQASMENIAQQAGYKADDFVNMDEFRRRLEENAEHVGVLQDSIVQLRDTMGLMQLLLEKQVNKPVVSSILLGEP